MRPLPLLIAAALSLTGCYDSSFGEPEDAITHTPVTTTIRSLCDTYTGKTVQVAGDIVISGRITANDLGENFYHTLSIEQEEAGLSVMAAVDQLHNDFPVGCRVTLRLKGLAIGRTLEVLQIGTMPAAGSSYATNYIPSKPALDAVLSRNGEALEAPVPALKTIPELAVSACGTLVRIEDVHYTPEDLTPGTWAGYKRFTDDTGREIYTYVRNYAGFADTDVPAGRCTLTGILQYDDKGDGRFILKLRDENDCTP